MDYAKGTSMIGGPFYTSPFYWTDSHDIIKVQSEKGKGKEVTIK